MTAPENGLGEWASPDPAEVARYGALIEAYTAQGNGRQQERAAAGDGDFLHELGEAAERTDQARLSGDASRIAVAEQAEWNLTQAAIDEAAEMEAGA